MRMVCRRRCRACDRMYMRICCWIRCPCACGTLSNVRTRREQQQCRSSDRLTASGRSSKGAGSVIMCACGRVGECPCCMGVVTSRPCRRPRQFMRMRRHLCCGQCDSLGTVYLAYCLHALATRRRWVVGYGVVVLVIGQSERGHAVAGTVQRAVECEQVRIYGSADV